MRLLPGTAMAAIVLVALLSSPVIQAAPTNTKAAAQAPAKEDGQNSEALLQIKRIELKIRKILGKVTKPGTPRHEAKKKVLKQVINQMFDFQELGKRSLSIHWDGLKPAQRKEFTGLLQSLIEKNYLMRISDRSTYEAKFVKYQCTGSEAEALVMVKSGTYEFDFTFRLFAGTQNKWLVYDMVIDDVSLIENYQSQFNSIIKKKGFPVLLEKMREKLNTDDSKSSAPLDDEEKKTR